MDNKQITISSESQLIKEIAEKYLSDMNKHLELIKEVLEKKYSTWIESYELTNTTERTPLKDPYNSLGNVPVNRLEVISTGGGLTLWINNMSKGFTAIAGTVIKDMDIYTIQYQVTSGTATIVLYARPEI